ncbi:MAG TPA: hypothetical protein RMI62_23105 [Polyangiaceae bacterium LLY-WYZ-15_(1-7)]|nr:hypothetical protein [Polyangiaceae bacterium LLY-WYZ-15_(1-7)]
MTSAASDDAPPSPLERGAAAVALLLAGGAGTLTAGMWPDNGVWLPAWIAATAVYVALAWGLWQGRAWARALGLGVALFGLAGWIEAWIVAGTSPTTVAASLAHCAFAPLLFWAPRRVGGRHGFALLAAGAALQPALGFALAPAQSGGTMAAVLAGAGLVVLGAIGVARGRTWGLLGALLGAPVLAAAVFYAPSLGFLTAPHPHLPANPVMLDLLGALAAGFAALSVAPWVAPMVGFLRGGR